MSTQNADVIIIGAGVIGSSIAYHLSISGFKNILVLESEDSPGQGSTGRATGGFRQQFGSEINIRLSLLSRKQLTEFKDTHSIDPGYIQAGYLFLAQNEIEMDNLKLASSLQKNTGVKDAVIVTPEEIIKINPHINMNNIIGGSFCQSDGFINPMNILNGYYTSSKNRGVKYCFGRKINKINYSGTKITSVETESEKFSAEHFINAAGAYAGWVAGLAAEYLPVRHLKRQVCVLYETGTLPADTPMTVWVDSSFHFRLKNDHLILLLPDTPENNYNYNTEVEESWLEKVFKIATDQLPAVNNCSIDPKKSWAGLYEMSPDEHLILGRSEYLENVYFANGSSGHGVMHSPAIGELLAGIISGQKNENGIDIELLSPNRFKEKKLIEQINFF